MITVATVMKSCMLGNSFVSTKAFVKRNMVFALTYLQEGVGETIGGDSADNRRRFGDDSDRGRENVARRGGDLQCRKTEIGTCHKFLGKYTTLDS